jgi:aspartate racemase
MKHIGVLAHSAEGSALCYLTICHAGSARLGAHLHPDITMSVVPMGVSMPAWEAGNLPEIRNTLASTVERLAKSECDFFVCPDNTAHLALEVEGQNLALPGLHIADVVMAEATKLGFSKVGILGTKWITGEGLYFDAARRRGIEAIAPPSADRAYVNSVIFEQLCRGAFTDEARAEHSRIISEFSAAGCDAVVLGCTELPLLVSQEDSILPILDSTRLLATYALDTALGVHAMPVWRGGAMVSDQLPDNRS